MGETEIAIWFCCPDAMKLDRKRIDEIMEEAMDQIVALAHLDESFGGIRPRGALVA
jgi:hypothetical protein